MKKLLGIVVLGLLLSFNTYAADKNLYLKCPETLQKIRIGEGALLKKGTLIGTNYVKLKSKSIITIHFNYEITKDKPFIIIENYRVKNDEIGFTATEKYKDKDYDSLDIYRFVQVENGYVFTRSKKWWAAKTKEYDEQHEDYDSAGRCENINKKEYKKLLK
tara:strand:+ start:831 stop:1313 length:483 start_codon:yes stop_codon:yes gene_type:complete